MDKLIELANDNMESKETLTTVSLMLSWQNYYDQALDIVNRALEKFENDPGLLVLKANHLSSIDEKEDAISLLSDPKYATIPSVAIALSDIYGDDRLEDAISVMHSAH